MEGLEKYNFEAHFNGMTPVIYIEQHITKNIDVLNWHKELEILHIKKGKGLVVYDSENINVTEGDICIINPYSAHTIFKDSDYVDCNVYIINDNFCRTYGIDFEKLRFCKNIKSEQIEMLLEQIRRELKNQDQYSNAYITGLVLQLCSILSRNYLLYSMNFETKSHIRKENINYAIAYINMNFKNQINLESVAEQLSLNKSYLAREFKRFTGMTVTQYINNLRCSYAQRIMANNEGKVLMSELSTECGFDNVYYFSNVFKKYIGISPSQYCKLIK